MQSLIKKGKCHGGLKKPTKTNPHHLWKPGCPNGVIQASREFPDFLANHNESYHVSWNLAQYQHPSVPSVHSGYSLKVSFLGLQNFQRVARHPRSLFLSLWVLRAVSKTQMMPLQGLPSMWHSYPPLQLVLVSNHPKQHLGLSPWHLLANI